MTIRRTSLLLPCRRLDDFPSHLTGQAAADLLAGWTCLWHPSLLHATGGLPGWHPTDEPPDPNTLDGELIVIPSVSRPRLPSDWCDRLRATAPQNAPPVDACASRAKTAEAALTAAEIDPEKIPGETVADFFALGYAHLQVELLTRAMSYTSVLDIEQFTGAVAAAANAAVARDETTTHEELARAFDLLADARNHVYGVDYYVIDVTLLAATTLGDSLCKKLATGSPTNVLMCGALIEELARSHPDSLAALRDAMAAGTAAIVGGMHHVRPCGGSPEALLGELERFQKPAREHLGREADIFGQFSSTFSPLLPEILDGLSFEAALHAAFDGGRLPRAEQCKTRWGRSDGAWIEALSTTPLDASQPETWLILAERVGDTIAHDHVATVLIAGWPGQEREYFGDLRRASRFNAVLGKLVTLKEYFRVSRETDDWSSFYPTEYRRQGAIEGVSNPISRQVRAHRSDVMQVYRQLSDGLRSLMPTAARGAVSESACAVVLNPWSFSCSRFVNTDPLDFTSAVKGVTTEPLILPAVPGCGFALRDASVKDSTAPSASTVALAEGRTLRNEQLEVTISATTGGIQSIRTHVDRSTRASQRLVFHDDAVAKRHQIAADADPPRPVNQMIADEVAITRNDRVVGEITSRGLLLDAADEPLARFTQTARVARGFPAVIVDVQLAPERPVTGDMWSSYFASRLVWLDEAAVLRRGAQWLARDVTHERVESTEWVEISADAGTIVCFGLGLPFHRHTEPIWLDTLLLTAGEEERRFQFALALDCPYPTQNALAMLTAGTPSLADLPYRLAQPRGWFVHVGARNVLVTHLTALGGEREGIRCRVLETEGRGIDTMLSTFRPFRAARFTNFRGEPNEVLSVVDGAVRFDLGEHQWRQIEAEW